MHNDTENHMVSDDAWEEYDGQTEPETDHDPEGEELRQRELDERRDSPLWSLAQDLTYSLSLGAFTKRQAD